MPLANDRIAIPVADTCLLLNDGRSLLDTHAITDGTAAAVAALGCGACTPFLSLTAQLGRQLGAGIELLIDALVTHAGHVLLFEALCDLLWRQAQIQVFPNQGPASLVNSSGVATSSLAFLAQRMGELGAVRPVWLATSGQLTLDGVNVARELTGNGLSWDTRSNEGFNLVSFVLIEVAVMCHVRQMNAQVDQMRMLAAHLNHLPNFNPHAVRS
jgi:hypothetical protein